MKIPLRIISIGSAFVTTAALAQPFSIDQFTTAGGGGTSTGGLFALHGTIGQPDAGALSGGQYSLAGGFWNTPSTPSLAPAPTLLELRVSSGLVWLRFNGIPGRTYDIERANTTTGPWPPAIQPLATITMPAGGNFSFVDTTGLTRPSSFYRTRLR